MFTPIPAIDRFIAAIGANIVYRETHVAYYWPLGDHIRMPPRGSRRTIQFYAVLFHEHVHWTGHHTRLKRRYGVSRQDINFAREEFVAITATLHLCAYFGLGDEGARNQLDYAEVYRRDVRGMPDVVRGAIADGRRAVLHLHEAARGAPVTAEEVMSRSVDALLLERFAEALPPAAPIPLAVPTLPVTAPTVHARLAPLVERFRTERRAAIDAVLTRESSAP